MNARFYIVAVFLILGILACNENYSPKPRAYFRTDFPARAYQVYSGNCPFEFEYPVYAQLNDDDSDIALDCWKTLDFVDFNAQVHLSYHPVVNNLDVILEDAHTLAYKHAIKADAINTSAYVDESNGVFGLVYEIEGNAASNLQFFVTDSVSHFVRGALYFNVRPNKDSLAPIELFVHEDVMRLIETFRWK